MTFDPLSKTAPVTSCTINPRSAFSFLVALECNMLNAWLREHHPPLALEGQLNEDKDFVLFSPEAPVLRIALGTQEVHEKVLIESIYIWLWNMVLFFLNLKLKVNPTQFMIYYHDWFMEGLTLALFYLLLFFKKQNKTTYSLSTPQFSSSSFFPRWQPLDQHLK